MQDNNTFIKLWRSFKKWEWYDDINTKTLFIHLLLSANYETKNWRGYLIEKGSFVTSYQKLSNETGLTVKQVRTALDKLKRTGEVASQSYSNFTIITIKNWIDYQENGKQQGKPTANEGQTEGKRRATTKEIKEYKEYKEDNILSVSKMVLDYLNKKTGKAYRYSDTSLRHIKARLNEGYSLEDCKHVIEVKCSQWLHSDMEKYLRPETLFGSKFDTYLNEQVKTPYMTQELPQRKEVTKEELEEVKRMIRGKA